MIDFFSILQFAGWLFIGITAYLFFITVGFESGFGILLPFIAKSDAQRHKLIKFITPAYFLNQTWFFILLGLLFAIWPRVYAALLSGLYLLALTIFWALLLKPFAYSYRFRFFPKKILLLFSWMLCIGCFICIFALGLIVGNLFLGLPFTFNPETLHYYYGLQANQYIVEPALISLVHLFKPFAILMAIFIVSLSVMHGGCYMLMKTTENLYKRISLIVSITTYGNILLFLAIILWLIFLPGFHWNPNTSLASLSETLYHPIKGQIVLFSIGGWLDNFIYHPWMILAPSTMVLASIGTLYHLSKKQNKQVFIMSMLCIFGVVLTVFLSLFPFIMPSSLMPDASLVIWNASSSKQSLMVTLIITLIMLPIIVGYTLYAHRKLLKTN